MYMTVKRFGMFLVAGICVGLGSFQNVAAQFEHHVLGARSASFGGSGLLLSGDLWAGYVNPALYATVGNFAGSITYIPGRFEMSELQSSAATIVYPFSFGTTATSIHRFGFDLYSETTISLSSARSIGDRLDIGGTVNWYHLAIERYGSTSTVGITAGIRAGISDQLTTGVVVSNINRPAVGENRNRLPQIIRAGVMYRPHPVLNIVAEIEKDVMFDPEFRFGAEYLFSGSFSVRAGMNDRPARAAGGFSVQHRSLQIDYGLQWHFELGQTHFITLSFILGERSVKRQPTDTSPVERILRRPSLNIYQLILDSQFLVQLEDPLIESLLRFINAADENELTGLPGIGEVMANRIIEYRNNHGPFEDINHLKNVQGIGEGTLENIIQFWRHSSDTNRSDP